MIDCVKNYQCNLAPYAGRRNSKLSFRGTTDTFIVTDSHQHTNDKCKLFSKILEKAQVKDNTLLLDNGDLFKGIYPPELEIDAYLKLKELAPNLEIVLNVGNNDPGYNPRNRELFKKAVKKFSENGIQVVSANTFQEKDGKRIDGIKPYAIVNRDGDKLLMAGFCVDTFTETVPDMESEDCVKVLNDLKDDIKKEKPDGIILMNHNFPEKNEELLDFAKKSGLNVDFVVGGHIHSVIDDNPEIIFPEPYSKSMVELNLNIDKNKPGNPHTITNRHIIPSKNLKMQKDLDKIMAPARKKLMKEVAPAAFDLAMAKEMKYTKQANFGTFMADGMKNLFNTDIAFFSSGSIVSSLKRNPNKNLTVLDIKEAIPGIGLEKTTVTPDVLKSVFENAFKYQSLRRWNKKGVQYSNNLRVVRRISLDKEKEKSFKNRVLQIYLNGKPLLDEKTGKALNPDQKITCTIDNFIGSGKETFSMLKDLPKEPTMYEGKKLGGIGVFIKYMSKVTKENPDMKEYPTARLDSIWV